MPKYLVRLSLIILPLFFLTLMFWSDLAPSGTKFIISDLANYSPDISRIYPEGRLKAPERVDGGWRQEVLAEPIYFDVKLPRRLNQAEVYLWYKKEGAPPKVGVRVGSQGAWQYNIVSLNMLAPENDWLVGKADFSLDNVAPYNHQIRFIISAPDINAASAPFILHHIEVHLKGEHLTIIDAGKKLFNYLNF